MAAKLAILHVAGEKPVLDWCARVLRHSGYQVDTVNSDRVMQSPSNPSCAVIVVSAGFEGAAVIDALLKGGAVSAVVISSDCQSSPVAQIVQRAVDRLATTGTTERAQGNVVSAEKAASISAENDLVEQILQRVIQGQLSQPACRGAAARLMASVAAKTPEDIPAFLATADILRATWIPTVAPGMVGMANEHSARLTTRREVAREIELDRLVLHLDRIGASWPSVGIGEIARILEVDAAICDRLLRAKLGVAWRRLRCAIVMRRVVVSLALTTGQISQIAYEVGYSHPSAFDRDFRALCGMAPRVYRQLCRQRDEIPP